MIHAFVKRAAVVQESSHCPALSGVTHGIAEHFVYLLLRGHPPVGVGGTVHPNEFCGNTNNSKKAETAGLSVDDDTKALLSQEHYRKVTWRTSAMP